MMPQRVDQAADPVAVVVIGATGDLSQRLLLPALYRLHSEGAISPALAVVGMSRRPMTHEQFRTFALSGVTQSIAVDPASWATFAARLFYVSADSTKEADYAHLARMLSDVEPRFATGGNRLFYLAAPPSTYELILTNLGRGELIRYGGGPPWTRVIIEKPFGHDEASARRLSALADRVIGEESCYRIDHYLGKETVQNMLVFRFANAVFEPVWNRRYVDHVQISFVEDIGVGGRGRFYEEVGVVRDVVQNHMLQLLAIIAMEPPVVFDAEGFRNEKAKVLRAIPALRPENAVRGQYAAGVVRGVRVPAYREEEGIDPGSTTPTYAAMRLQIDNWRWADVPFYLRAGKRLARKDTEVVVVFRQPPLRLFRDYDMAGMDHNVLVLKTTDDQKITLRFAARVPGHQHQIRSVALDFSYRDFGEPEHPPYEHLLLDALRGVQTSFPRRDEVELQWAIVDPLLRFWEQHPPQDFPNYAAGSDGPQQADELLAREGRRWRAD
jgi:glucose-6-phosphate 1-dehydrogenase